MREKKRRQNIFFVILWITLRKSDDEGSPVSIELKIFILF